MMCSVSRSQVQPLAVLLFLGGLCLCNCTNTVIGQPSSVGSTPAVILVPGPEGHLSVGLQGTAPLTDRDLSFESLKTWQLNQDSLATPAPQTIARLHQQIVRINGFMFPLQEGDSIKAFLLMATTQTCCYGPRPEFNQFALVETSEAVPFVRLKPVQVTGRFYVEPRPEDGYIMRIEATQCQPLSGSDIRNSASLPQPSEDKITWDDLQSLHRNAADVGMDKFALPASWSRLVGRRVLAEGNLVVEKLDDPDGKLFVASHAWDGCCMGTPPAAFDSLLLHFASDSIRPSPWHRSGLLEGTLGILPPEHRTRDRFFVMTQVTARQLSDRHLGKVTQSQFPPPLHQAVTNEDLPGVRLFLRGGTSANQRDFKGNTPLHFCQLPSRIAIASYLLEHGADANARNRDHRTPLHEAAAVGNASFSRLLLDHQADINATDSYGFTPTAWAIVQGQEDHALWLLSQGADAGIRNADGRSLVWLSAQFGQARLLEALIKAGQDVNLSDRRKVSPLMAAQERKDEAIIKLLVAAGAR